MLTKEFETAETRIASGEILAELGGIYPNLVVLGGDLNKSTQVTKFADLYPDRFFDFGPAEQNIVSVAAGLASSGKIPIVSTFAVFGSSRPYDQIRVGVSQPNLNVKIIVTHAGLLTGEDGVSAQSIEDIAIMTALPNFNVVVPSDTIETKSAIKNAIETEGPFYIRLSRPPTPIIHNEENFKLGKGEVIKDGSDVTIIACGVMVSKAMIAAENLAIKGITCKIINMSTIKPIDSSIIIESAIKTGAVVTAEEHYINGGLGSAVGLVLGNNIPTPTENVALIGYAESGQPEELINKYNLSPTAIANAVEKAISRKSNTAN
jgi:transketolase